MIEPKLCPVCGKDYCRCNPVWKINSGLRSENETLLTRVLLAKQQVVELRERLEVSSQIFAAEIASLRSQLKELAEAERKYAPPEVVGDGDFDVYVWAAWVAAHRAQVEEGK